MKQQVRKISFTLGFLQSVKFSILLRCILLESKQVIDHSSCNIRGVAKYVRAAENEHKTWVKSFRRTSFLRLTR